LLDSSYEESVVGGRAGTYEAMDDDQTSPVSNTSTSNALPARASVSETEQGPSPLSGSSKSARHTVPSIFLAMFRANKGLFIITSICDFLYYVSTMMQPYLISGLTGTPPSCDTVSHIT